MHNSTICTDKNFGISTKPGTMQKNSEMVVFRPNANELRLVVKVQAPYKERGPYQDVFRKSYTRENAAQAAKDFTKIEKSRKIETVKAVIG